MNVIGIIPARGGSKGILKKNIQPVNGIPLVVRTINALSEAIGLINVYVSTDSDEIAEIASKNGASIINRPSEIAGDTATSESAILHAIDVLEDKKKPCDIIVFAQCTSPFISSEEVKEAVSMIKSGEFQSVFSAKSNHSFLWTLTSDGEMKGVNHSKNLQRQRRQDLANNFLETGAFYVFKGDSFRKTQNRFCGKTGIVISKVNPIDIDEASDLVIAEAFAKFIEKETIKDR